MTKTPGDSNGGAYIATEMTMENDEQQQENDAEIVNSNRDDKGRWLDRGESPAPLFDSKTGKAAIEKRWRGYQDATARGVVKKAREIFPDDDIRTPYQAWQKIAESQYEKALNNPPSAKLIMQALDTVPRSGGGSGTTIDKQQINVYMMNYTGLVENIQELADKFRAEGDEAKAAYIEAQIEHDNEYPQRITYPQELKGWRKKE